MTDQDPQQSQSPQADPLADINARMKAHIKKMTTELYPKSAPHTPKDHPERVKLLEEYKDAEEILCGFWKEASALDDNDQISKFTWREWDTIYTNHLNAWYQAREKATGEPKPDLSNLRDPGWSQGN